jgi:serine/threonine-protein kinase
MGPSEGGAEAATDSSAAAAEPAVDAPITSLLRVTSVPTGAEVLIDGKSVGKTPFQSKEIDATAPHALTIRKDGYDNHEHMISSSDWTRGKGKQANTQNVRVAVKLRKTPGAEPAAGTDPAEGIKSAPGPAPTPAPAAGTPEPAKEAPPTPAPPATPTPESP